MKRKVCVECGRELKGARTKFCGEICSYNFKRERERLKRIRIVIDPISCEVCKKTFTPKTTRQRFCTNECWHIKNNIKRNRLRKLNASKPKVRPQDRFAPNWKSPTFGEREVTTASFVNCESAERQELKSAVLAYLENGGKITRYNDQIPTLYIESDLKWNVPESEEKEIQTELERLWGVEDVLGN